MQMQMKPCKQLLIQVVPRLLPGRCGVSDQAILLAGELKSAFAIESAFVVLNSNERCDVPYQVIHTAPEQLLQVCQKLSGGDHTAMLVHVSGYGYASNGAPARLAEAIAKVRAAGLFRISVYFHELFATGMPWRSVFWHSHRQKRAVCRIAEDADLIVTSSGYHTKWLEHLPTKRTSIPVQLFPVFSAVGEAQNPAPVMQRDSAMAVFGLPSTRKRSYTALSSLAETLNHLGVTEISDIGPPFDAPTNLGGIPVIRRGSLTATDIASRLSRTKFGFLSHDPLSLAKSSVCASYSAQGTIPVIARPFSGEVDGLKDGVQVISSQTAEAANASGLQKCSTAAWVWHTKHNLHAHASIYRDWLTKSSNESCADKVAGT